MQGAQVYVDTQRLFESLPEATKRGLSEIGITSVNYEQMSQLDAGKIFRQMVEMLGNSSHTALTGMSVCMGIMLLCCMTEGFQVTLADRKLSRTANMVGTMSICTAIVVPLCSTIAGAVEVLNGAAGFMMLYIPIMAGLLLSAGQEVTGTSYYTVMMTAGNAVSSVSAKFISPLMNIFLALTVMSSLSQKMNLKALCNSVYQFAKWVLTFVMAIFTGVMSLQTIVTSSMDHVSKKALRFAVSSFVPVVGGALGEALNTFNGSLELLRSGAGVFVIIASAWIVLPSAAECIVWQFALFVLSSAGDFMGLSVMSGLFRSISKAVAMMTALLFCVMTVFIISTGMILMTGRG